MNPLLIIIIAIGIIITIFILDYWTNIAFNWIRFKISMLYYTIIFFYFSYKYKNDKKLKEAFKKLYKDSFKALRYEST